MSTTWSEQAIMMTLSAIAYQSDIAGQLKKKNYATAGDWSLAWGPIQDSYGNLAYVAVSASTGNYALVIRGSLTTFTWAALENWFYDLDVVLQSSWPYSCSSPGAMPLAAPGGNAPGATVSVTGLRVPKDARKAYEKAQHALQKRELVEAQAELEQAVHLYPQYAAAWTDLGWLYAQQNRLDPARHAFAQARSADQNFVPAYLGLAAVAMRESKWPEVVELSARAARLDGADFPAAFYYHSLGNFQLGKLDNAEGSARKAEGLDPHHAWPQASLLLGVILAQKQDYSGGAEEFKSYLKSAPKAANADKVRHQLAELEKLTASESKAAAAPPSK